MTESMDQHTAMLAEIERLKAENKTLQDLVESLAKEYMLDHGIESLREKYGIIASIR